MLNKLLKLFQERCEDTPNGPLVAATRMAIYRGQRPPRDYGRLTSYSLQIIRRPSWSNVVKIFPLRQTVWPLGSDKVGQLLI